jgi:pimeloyl-ACP methyl ester carboxylesterase
MDARESLLAGMPLTQTRRDLSGVSTAVLEGGDSPSVVLLHGPGEFAGKWMSVVPDLVATHRVVAPDLPGHGASQVTDGQLDAGRVLAWVGELIDQTCDTPPVLVGHGLGLAASFATDHGDRISGLVQARYGWSLHVIDDAADDPVIEAPEAFLAALRTVLNGDSPTRPRT